MTNSKSLINRGGFGFLSSDEVNLFGVVNAGLRDQMFALQWVQNYIHLFGENASQVSISGNSAGDGSASHDGLGRNSWNFFVYQCQWREKYLFGSILLYFVMLSLRTWSSGTFVFFQAFKHFNESKLYAVVSSP